MIEIKDGVVHYTNSRNTTSVVGVVESDAKSHGSKWTFIPDEGIHAKVLPVVEELLREHYKFPIIAAILDDDDDSPLEMREIPIVPTNPDDEPAQEPSMGDKTPEWMVWFKRTNPKAFSDRYKSRKVPTIE